MTVKLGPEARKIVEERLRGGKFGSADEVVLAGLRALDNFETAEADELDEDIQKAIQRAEKAKFLGSHLMALTGRGG